MLADGSDAANDARHLTQRAARPLPLPRQQRAHAHSAVVSRRQLLADAAAAASLRIRQPLNNSLYCMSDQTAGAIVTVRVEKETGYKAVEAQVNNDTIPGESQPYLFASYFLPRPRPRPPVCIDLWEGRCFNRVTAAFKCLHNRRLTHS
ncbi:hypothetical protein J6590_018853 [Homalodisca vitripennis]|nr:hypothetical protein J6590_018853 [Homalodisca vitripennis]